MKLPSILSRLRLISHPLRKQPVQAWKNKIKRVKRSHSHTPLKLTRHLSSFWPQKKINASVSKVSNHHRLPGSRCKQKKASQQLVSIQGVNPQKLVQIEILKVINQQVAKKDFRKDQDETFRQTKIRVSNLRPLTHPLRREETKN